MSHSWSWPRLVIGPAAVAAFAGFELRRGGRFPAVVVGWCVFVLCVFAIQPKRRERRLELLRDRRSGSTR